MKKSIGIKDIIFPNPVFIVGTYDKNGKPNFMNVAWAGFVGGDNDSVVIAIRPSRYTYDNLNERKAFTISVPSADYLSEADYFGLASGRTEDKIKKTGLTSVDAEFVDAPYIKEFPYILECQVNNTLDLGAHKLFVGDIKDIKVDEDKLTDNNLPDWDKIKPLTYDRVNNEYRLPGTIAGKAFSDGMKFLK